MQCPILLPQDVDVTDFGDLSKADDSVLLDLILEPKENCVRATQYVDKRITKRIQNVFQETEEIDVPEFMRIINMINVSICIRLSDTKLVDLPPMKLKAMPTSITKINVEMHTINVSSDGTCTLRDCSFRDESKTKRMRYEADYDDFEPCRHHCNGEEEGSVHVTFLGQSNSAYLYGNISVHQSVR